PRPGAARPLHGQGREAAPGPGWVVGPFDVCRGWWPPRPRDEGRCLVRGERHGVRRRVTPGERPRREAQRPRVARLVDDVERVGETVRDPEVLTDQDHAVRLHVASARKDLLGDRLLGKAGDLIKVEARRGGRGATL